MPKTKKILRRVLRLVIFITIILALVGFAGFIMLSIACGGGQGVGVAIVFGPIIIVILITLYKSLAKLGREQDNKFDEKTQALINYIATARLKNLKDAEIRNNLKYQGGWKNEDINKAFEYINTNKIES